jgi:Txe/YoeB family toxin of Txe-Axe toxin-antitoxin module
MGSFEYDRNCFNIFWVGSKKKRFKMTNSIKKIIKNIKQDLKKIERVEKIMFGKREYEQERIKQEAEQLLKEVKEEDEDEKRI